MRLFIAVCFDDKTKNALCDTMQRLGRHMKGCNFTSRENLHLTLSFIGETSRAADVRQAMELVSANEFDLTFGGLGSFRRENGRIYWIGVMNNKTLHRIYQQLYDALKGSGFSIESRPFKPHLTLCREARPESGFDEGAFSAMVPDISMSVSKICLMKSERLAGRLVYTCIHEKKLSGGKT